MLNKNRDVTLTKFELHLERLTFAVVGGILSAFIMGFIFPKNDPDQQLYRIHHMVKACIPSGGEQFTIMRLEKRSGKDELVCEKRSVILTNPLKPMAGRNV